MNQLPYWLFVLAIVVFYLANQPNLSAQIISISQNLKSAKFVYTSVALFILLMFSKGCSDTAKLQKYADKDGRLNSYSASGIDSNALEAVRFLETHKGNSWQLGDAAQKYTTKKWDKLAIYYFEQAEACETNSPYYPSWRQFRPKYIISLFRVGRDQEAANQLAKFLHDVEAAISGHDPKLAEALTGENWERYAKDRVTELEDEFPDQTKEFHKKLESILTPKTR